MTEERKLLLLQARNLGDAVISTAVVETVAQGLPGVAIDVLTRPEVAPIFAHNPGVHMVFTSKFPMGSGSTFGMRDLALLSSVVSRLRRGVYTDVVNLEGDFREDLLGRLMSKQRNWSPAWAPGHPCSRVVRRSVIPLANRPVMIPNSLSNVHDAAALVATSVTGAEAKKPALYTPDRKKLVWNPGTRSVGLHPMASQPWRRWELAKWSAVAEVLVAQGMDVFVFGAPSEADELDQVFGKLRRSGLEIVAGGLSEYFAAVTKMRVLLCPDSFASHVAYALGVPTILLNGANDAEAWAPPGTHVLAAGPGLPCYPCYNRPSCMGTAHQYKCVRGIEIESVLEAVREVLGMVEHESTYATHPLSS